MSQQESLAVEERKRRPWDVVQRSDGTNPQNELRFSGTIWLALAASLLTVVAAVFAVSAVSRQGEFRELVSNAKQSGFPQVPPAHFATDDDKTDFIEEWNISCDDMINGISHCEYVDVFSDQRSDYENEYSTSFMVFAVSIFVALLLFAIAFSRALNNLYALGYRMSQIPPAWAFSGFFVPLINLYLPWIVVSQVWKTAWGSHDDQDSSGASIISIGWGVIAAATVFLNPWVMGWVMRRSDIDGWLMHLQWVSFGIVWVIVAALITAIVLVLVSIRQRARYKQLEALARA